MDLWNNFTWSFFHISFSRILLSYFVPLVGQNFLRYGMFHNQITSRYRSSIIQYSRSWLKSITHNSSITWSFPEEKTKHTIGIVCKDTTQQKLTEPNCHYVIQVFSTWQWPHKSDIFPPESFSFHKNVTIHPQFINFSPSMILSICAPLLTSPVEVEDIVESARMSVKIVFILLQWVGVT